MRLFMPVRLYCGKDCVAINAAEFAKLGNSCLIVCSPASARLNGALNDVMAALKAQDIRSAVYNGITPNPTVAVCISAAKIARDSAADFILGIGGGSAMDAAKAIAVFAANAELEENGFYKKLWKNPPLPIALIGTTAGTGSEVTMVSVLTDKAGHKHSIHDERLYASLAMGDPKYLATMPRGLTLSTGIDAVSHCIESYFSEKADFFSRTYALDGVKRMLKPLKEALHDGLTADLREEMYLGSIYGGLAINMTGTCFPHNLGYYLTERFGIAHGTASAAFLKDLLQFEAEVNPAMTQELYSLIDTSEQELFNLIDASVDLSGVRISMEELNSILPRWQENSSVKNTKGSITLERIRLILSKFVQEA